MHEGRVGGLLDTGCLNLLLITTECVLTRVESLSEQEAADERRQDLRRRYDTMVPGPVGFSRGSRMVQVPKRGAQKFIRAAKREANAIIGQIACAGIPVQSIFKPCQLYFLRVR